MSNQFNTDGMFTYSQTESVLKTNVFDSVIRTIAFDVRDWFEDRRSAWIYCIVFGMGNERANFCKKKFGWDDADIDRNRRLHEQWEEARRLLDEKQRGE